MANPKDTHQNDALELTSEESSSSMGVVNLEFVVLLYGRNFPTLIPYMHKGGSRSGLDSFIDDVDL